MVSSTTLVPRSQCTPWSIPPTGKDRLRVGVTSSKTSEESPDVSVPPPPVHRVLTGVTYGGVVGQPLSRPFVPCTRTPSGVPVQEVRPSETVFGDTVGGGRTGAYVSGRGGAGSRVLRSQSFVCLYGRTDVYLRLARVLLKVGRPDTAGNDFPGRLTGSEEKTRVFTVG